MHIFLYIIYIFFFLRLSSSLFLRIARYAIAYYLTFHRTSLRAFAITLKFLRDLSSSDPSFASLAYVNLLLINIVAITWHFFALYTIIRRINKAKFLSLSFAHLSRYIPPCISEECVCHACANMRCEAGAKLHDNLSPHRRFLSYCFAVFLR